MGLFVLSIYTVVFVLSIQRGQCAHIIRGVESKRHSRPYMAALSHGPTNFFCGGTLIHENWVLTAAHCVKEFYKGLNVVLGAHVQGNNIENGRQYIGIANYFIHPNFRLPSFENDIMLLKLQKKARINQYVQTIPLPQTYTDVPTGTQCLVTGWGLTEQLRPADTLRETYVTIMDRRICNDQNHWKGEAVKMNMLCADDNRRFKDTCFGDSGGPLLCNGVQKGIVSFGYENRCADPEHPTVYTFLTYEHLNWISSVTTYN